MINRILLMLHYFYLAGLITLGMVICVTGLPVVYWLLVGNCRPFLSLADLILKQFEQA